MTQQLNKFDNEPNINTIVVSWVLTMHLKDLGFRCMVLTKP